MADGYPLMTPAAVAAYLDCTVPDLADMRRRGDGPRDVKIGPRTIRYQLTDVGSWKLQRIVKVDEPDRPGRT